MQHELDEVPARCRDQGGLIHARALRVPHAFIRKIFRAGPVVERGGIQALADPLMQKLKRGGHSPSPQAKA